MTTILLWIMHFIPGLRLRCDEETEVRGVDDAELGQVIQLQGDQRQKIFSFLTEQGVDKGTINVHGF